MKLEGLTFEEAYKKVLEKDCRAKFRSYSMSLYHWKDGPKVECIQWYRDRYLEKDFWEIDLKDLIGTKGWVINNEN